MKKLKYLVATVFLICTFLFITGCGKSKLSAPTNLTVDLNNKLTWNPVENARSYYVEIKNTDGEVVVKNKDGSLPISRKNNYSLSKLAEGDYKINVIAIAGNAKDKNSAPSETLEFHKDYDNGCTYELIRNGTEYRLVKSGSAAGDILIKSVYRGKPVTEIAEGAFKGNGRITSVVIESGIKVISDKAFYNCSRLTSVVVPDTVTEIGISAFQSCRLLTSVRLPQDLTIIPEWMFAYCKGLEQITLGDKIETISKNAFADCTSLKSIVIPDSVVQIGESAFVNNASMTSVTIGKNVASLDKMAFYRCAELVEVNFASEGNLKIIDTFAFSECNKLETIEFPDGVEDLGRAVCYMSESLVNIVIPDSVKHVGSFAFNATKSYKNQSEAGEKFIYADKWLIYCVPDYRETVEELTPESFKNGIIGIADDAVFGAKSLGKITLPQTLKVIGQQAFASCPKLWSLNFPDNSVTHIQLAAFANCTVLKQPNLGKGLLDIDDYAFAGCSQLANPTGSTKSIIPDSVTRVGYRAFYNTALWESATGGVVYAGNWVVGFKDDLPSNAVLKNTITGIADYAFYKCPTLVTLSGTANTSNIGKAAFYGCIGLAAISLNADMVEIKPYTFYGCISLYAVKMPAFLEKIGRAAFYACQTLDTVDFKEIEIKEIDINAFYGCINLTFVDLGEKLEFLGDNAFYKCFALESVVIPGTLKKISFRAFYKNTALTTVNFGNGIEEIGESAFSGCSALTSINLPSSVKKIGNKAFYKCTSVTRVNFSEGLESIGFYAFYEMENIIQLVFPQSLTSIGKYAFKGCKALTSIVLGDNIDYIGAVAFYGCSDVTFYMQADSDVEEGNARTEKWDVRWNVSYRPVVMDCTLSADKTYVVSVQIKDKTLLNKQAKGGFTAPVREGYTFAGWATSPDATEPNYDAAQLTEVPTGTTLYAVWVLNTVAPEDAPAAE